MSILHLETGRHVYGGALQVLYLVRGLVARGIPSRLVVPDGSDVASAAADWGLPVETVRFSGEADLPAVARLRRTFAEGDVELVHLHSRRGADTLGGVAARLAGVPAVLTRRVDNREVRPFAVLKYRLYQRVVAISEVIRTVLVAQGVPGAKIDLVPSAVDGDRWASPRTRAELGHVFDVDDAETVGCMVAQFIARKGHRTLVEALQILRARGRAPVVVAFGRGPLLDDVRRRAEDAGVGDRLRLVGFREDLPDWVGAFDFCVHPATKEGLGVAAIQAGAAGIPVLGARAGGIPEVVSDGVTGVLVPPGDPVALAEGMQRLIDDPTAARAMGDRARIRVARHFSVDSMVEGNIGVYRAVLGSDWRV